jgi:hypothetical protein
MVGMAHDYGHVHVSTQDLKEQAPSTVPQLVEGETWCLESEYTGW